LTDVATGGSATATACIFTNPLEVIKTRLQVQGEMQSGGAARYKGVGDAMMQIARHEGVLSLQKGLVPGMIYQVRCGSLCWVPSAVASLARSLERSMVAASCRQAWRYR